MSKFVVIPRGNGLITHKNVDPKEMNIPEEAEIFEDRDAFDDRLSEFE